jgi:hypothetical protein
MDARPDEPGGITKDGGSLCVRRSKNPSRDNPYAQVHDGLKELLSAHKAWHQQRYPNSVHIGPATRPLSACIFEFERLPRLSEELRPKVGRQFRDLSAELALPWRVIALDQRERSTLRGVPGALRAEEPAHQPGPLPDRPAATGYGGTHAHQDERQQLPDHRAGAGHAPDGTTGGADHEARRFR